MTAIDKYTAGLDVYLVGGAVRDQLMGLPIGDRDWVVVGSDPDNMLARGFNPVGSDFPVFLHPETHEEYALARTERKSGRGYHGFTFYAGNDVSLVDDLNRRDLTINAMAQAADGTIIDPYGGRADIQNKLLRHVGLAFVEDPVRLLRLARFAARFDGFTVASETVSLCHAMVANGELDALVPERVWQEFAKGLSTNNPARMLEVLQQSNALARVAPKLVWNEQQGQYLTCAVNNKLNLEQRYALMCYLSDGMTDLKAPTACKNLALLLPKVINLLLNSKYNPAQTSQDKYGYQLKSKQSIDLFELCDAFRRPERCINILVAAQCITPIEPISLWRQRLDAAMGIDAGAIAKAANGDVDSIKKNIYKSRIQAIEQIC